MVCEQQQAVLRQLYLGAQLQLHVHVRDREIQAEASEDLQKHTTPHEKDAKNRIS